MNYKDYTIEDFIKDDLFVKWAKNADHESGEFWEKWIQNNPAKRKDILQAKHIVQNLELAYTPELQEEDYLEMFEKIFKEDHSHTIAFEEEQEKSFLQNYKKIAAVLLPLLLAFAGAYLIVENFENLGKEKITATELLEKSTPKGMKSTLTLGDGTTVKLNAESSLKFSRFFEGETRKVFLTGEAFFDVTENPAKPFIVVVNDIEAKVLGTSFNINSYEGVEISLVTGKLKVSNQEGNSFILKPNDRITYKKTGEVVKDKFDPKEVVAWKNGTILFQEDDFQTILNKLERWYGVTFILKPGLSFKEKFTGRFQDESLENVLKGMKISFNFKYKIDGKIVTLTHENK